MIANLDNLKSIFSKMEDDGWNTLETLKWGFFFVDAKKKNLKKFFYELQDHNYKLESLSKTDDGKWQLFVTKPDILSPDKLHSRNNAFNELAAVLGVELYDGWDVGKIQ